MKNLIYTAILSLFCTVAAFSQSAFSYSPDSVWITGTPQQTDIEGHANVQNMSAEVKTIKWERTHIMLTQGCQTQVCDANLCYLPAISSKKFDIDPNQVVPMIVHMVNQTGNPCCAVVRLKLSDFNNPADSVESFYLFNDCAVLATGEPLPAANVRVFPNPVSTHFMLDNASDVSALRVYSMDGKEILHAVASPDHVYDLSGQAAGNYILTLADKYGRNFQAIELHKN